MSATRNTTVNTNQREKNLSKGVTGVINVDVRLVFVFIFSIVNEALKQPNIHKDQIKAIKRNDHVGSVVYE